MIPQSDMGRSLRQRVADLKAAVDGLLRADTATRLTSYDTDLTALKATVAANRTGLDALTAKVVALEAAAVRRPTAGAVTVSIPMTVVGNSAGPYTVPLDRELPDTSYVATPVVTGLPSGLLAGVRADVTQRLKGSVNVTLRITGVRCRLRPGS